MMGFIFDFIFIAFIVYYALRASKTNLNEQIFRLLYSIFSVLISVFLGIFFAQKTYIFFYKDALAKKIIDVVALIPNIDGQSTSLECILRRYPRFIENSAPFYYINEENFENEINRISIMPAEESSQILTDMLTTPIVTGVFTAIYSVVICLFFAFLLNVVLKYYNRRNCFSELSYIDNTLCKIIGSVNGVINLLIPTTAIRLVFPVFTFYTKLKSEIDDSIFFSFLYNHNIFLKYIGISEG